MWDLFPEPVMLVHKNRTILATNALGQDFGIPLGSRCHELNPEAGDHPCRQCLANEALRTGQATITQTEKDGVPLTAFWVPVQGQADLYIHFGIGTLARYEAKAES